MTGTQKLGKPGGVASVYQCKLEKTAESGENKTILWRNTLSITKGHHKTKISSLLELGIKNCELAI